MGMLRKFFRNIRGRALAERIVIDRPELNGLSLNEQIDAYLAVMIPARLAVMRAYETLCEERRQSNRSVPPDPPHPLLLGDVLAFRATKPKTHYLVLIELLTVVNAELFAAHQGVEQKRKILADMEDGIFDITDEACRILQEKEAQKDVNNRLN